jgi:hypothetical protein
MHKMKKLTSALSAILLSSTTLIFNACDDGHATPEVKPVTVFNTNIDGQPFNAKVFTGRFFPQNQSIDIEGHELDSTFDNQIVIGLQIEYDKFNTPGDYDFEEHEVVDDIIFYFLTNDGKSYYPREGILTIKKINADELEATFSSLLLKSSYPNAPDITLTDGTIRVDLVEVND